MDKNQLNQYKRFHIVGIYHPPSSSNNQTTNTTFINEITDLSTKKITNLGNLIKLGDLNINTEDNTNAENTIFNDTMKAIGLEQHVEGPMHRLGSTLLDCKNNTKLFSVVNSITNNRPSNTLPENKSDESLIRLLSLSVYMRNKIW